MSGYLHPEYTKALSEFGLPRRLVHCEGWILVREIAQSGYLDAMGPYPLFTCKDWTKLPQDLAALQAELVSLALVTDPFGDYDLSLLQSCFRDIVVPFKEHYVVDLQATPEHFVSKHHQRNVRKGMNKVQIETSVNPSSYLSDWVSLYDFLIDRHEIKGITAFSELSFARQFNVPGIVAFRALSDAETVGMTLWYVQDTIAYYHLGASNGRGYSLHASFALFWHAIEYFARQGLRWLDLGAGAGLSGSVSDGLARFKSGWATGTRTAYFCGRVFDHKKYNELKNAHPSEITDYFPAYRQGEFRNG